MQANTLLIYACSILTIMSEISIWYMISSTLEFGAGRIDTKTKLPLLSIPTVSINQNLKRNSHLQSGVCEECA
jgi:hypothetical protein